MFAGVAAPLNLPSWLPALLTCVTKSYPCSRSNARNSMRSRDSPVLGNMPASISSSPAAERMVLSAALAAEAAMPPLVLNLTRMFPASFCFASADESLVGMNDGTSSCARESAEPESRSVPTRSEEMPEREEKAGAMLGAYLRELKGGWWSEE